MVKDQQPFFGFFPGFPDLWEILLWVGIIGNVGTRMSDTTVKVDEKGRIIIPKNIRETTKLKEGSYVNIRSKGKVIIIEPAEPAADKYRGAFKIIKWPEDMDEFIVEVMQKWWTKSAT
jgi:AbrB family looped-hinge helix DNA binding protein